MARNRLNPADSDTGDSWDASWNDTGSIDLNSDPGPEDDPVKSSGGIFGDMANTLEEQGNPVSADHWRKMDTAAQTGDPGFKDLADKVSLHRDAMNYFNSIKDSPVRNDKMEYWMSKWHDDNGDPEGADAWRQIGRQQRDNLPQLDPHPLDPLVETFTNQAGFTIDPDHPMDFGVSSSPYGVHDRDAGEFHPSKKAVGQDLYDPTPIKPLPVPGYFDHTALFQPDSNGVLPFHKLYDQYHGTDLVEQNKPLPLNDDSGADTGKTDDTQFNADANGKDAPSSEATDSGAAEKSGNDKSDNKNDPSKISWDAVGGHGETPPPLITRDGDTNRKSGEDATKTTTDYNGQIAEKDRVDPRLLNNPSERNSVEVNTPTTNDNKKGSFNDRVNEVVGILKQNGKENYLEPSRMQDEDGNSIPMLKNGALNHLANSAMLHLVYEPGMTSEEVEKKLNTFLDKVYTEGVEKSDGKFRGLPDDFNPERTAKDAATLSRKEWRNKVWNEGEYDIKSKHEEQNDLQEANLEKYTDDKEKVNQLPSEERKALESVISSIQQSQAGNYHFGITCRSQGFDDQTCHKGAGIFQRASDVKDTVSETIHNAPSTSELIKNTVNSWNGKNNASFGEFSPDADWSKVRLWERKGGTNDDPYGDRSVDGKAIDEGIGAYERMLRNRWQQRNNEAPLKAP